MIIKSKAKINLFLKIYNKNQDYHFLHSLIVFCDDVYDELEIIESDNNIIELLPSEFSRFVPQEKNILWKIFDNYKFQKKYHIRLKKNIPVAAGLGGGSSNAAMLIKFLLETDLEKNSNLNMSSIVKLFGSDVPVCLNQTASYISSFGEEVQKSNLPLNLWAVLVNPKLEVSTAEIFQKFNFKDCIYKREYLDFKNRDELLSFLKTSDNDLEETTIAILPEVISILKEIALTENCKLARMSGSGATCFGLFYSRNDAIKAKKKLEYINTNWWIKETLLI